MAVALPLRRHQCSGKRKAVLLWMQVKVSRRKNTYTSWIPQAPGDHAHSSLLLYLGGSLALRSRFSSPSLSSPFPRLSLLSSPLLFGLQQCPLAILASNRSAPPDSGGPGPMALG
jgi:hypothetical protein